MKADNEDQWSPAELVAMEQDSSKAKISYTRQFLLSLSELDTCKKFPEGFDPAILSDFGEASNSVLERPRILGSLSSQNFRRGEYGSSPPTRGDSGNYSRGSHGRWDSRSSGSNERDADSQLEWESESGRRYGNHPRRSWQNPEHDGLLGSGAFPRPPGSAAGTSTAKARGNGPYQLNRTNEPYHPPRPYKAVLHSRREITDSINDETFGSSEISSEDRVEEEKKRRASFDQFRKEQKALHEKEKQFPDKHKGSNDPDIMALLGDSEHDKKKLWDQTNGTEDVIPTVSQGDSAKISLPAQSSASRPLIPPGFASTVVEKSFGAKPSTHPALEVGGIGLEGSITYSEDNLMKNGTCDRQAGNKSEPHLGSSEMQYEIKINPILFTDVSEKLAIRPSDAKVSSDSVGDFSQSLRVPNPPEVSESQMTDEVTYFDAQKVSAHDLMDTTGQEHSTSILDTLFGKASTVNNGGSSFIEDGAVNVDESGTDVLFQSSKFTHWFLEEEKKPTDDPSFGKPTNLLSLIVGGEKGESQFSGVSYQKASIIPLEGNTLFDRFITSGTASAAGAAGEPPYHSNAPDATGGVLTCEDLEQSMLLEISENSSKAPLSEQPWVSSDTKSEQAKAGVDNHATQHILSLLKKETTTNDLTPSSNLGAFTENVPVYEPGTVSSVLDNPNTGNAEKVENAAKSLTLETLFGSSFMNALHSAEAPVSAQRGSVGGSTRSDGAEPWGFPFPAADDGFFPLTPNNTILQSDVHASNPVQSKSNKYEDHWLGYETPQSKVEQGLNIVVAAKDRVHEKLEIQLPEEESLITVGDPVVSHLSVPVGNETKDDSLSSSSAPDIVNKLAALNAVLKSERSTLQRQDGPLLRRGPYDPTESEVPFQNLHGKPSSPQFNHLQMNHGRSSFQPLDSHLSQMNPQIKYMGPDHPEVASHHQFPIFRSPFQANPSMPSRFDSPQHHPMLQQMHMQGNHLPSHLLHGLPRGPCIPPYPVNNLPGYVPEMNQMQGFPYGHRQPSYGAPEMHMPAPGVGAGSNHPEALEKLFEMELRANMRQMPHPISGTVHALGNQNPGIDMGFRYR